jgi:PIN domain nuclease of toxin-antitoxin system
MRLLLDTHVLLWWHDQPVRLTETAYDAINDPGNDVFLSVVNGWEIQIKAQLGKLMLPKPLHVIF